MPSSPARPKLRLDQILANFGYCSRREANKWVKSGYVTDLAGAELDDAALRMDPAEVLVRGETIEFPHGLLVALHKPVGVTCSHDPAESPLVYDLLPAEWLDRNPKVTSVGRLDKETSGLLLITDQGPLVQRWTSPKHHLPKVYELVTSSPMPTGLEELFLSGTLLLRGEKAPCQPATLVRTSDTEASVTLHEGKYHQVRRMFASQGCPIVSLHRSSFGGLTLGDLAEEEWRECTVAEIEAELVS